MDIAGSMNITFKADIAELVGHRPSVLYWVIQPGSNVGGIGAGLVRMVRPWNEWLIVWGYDINEPPPAVDDDGGDADRPQPLGVPDLDVEITGTSLWGNNEMYATHLQTRAGVLRRRRRAPAPAEQRAGLQHLHPGLLQPGLEARRRAQRPGRRRNCWTPTPPSARRWPSRSCCGPTSPAASSASSSRRSGVDEAETEAGDDRQRSRSARPTPREGAPSAAALVDGDGAEELRVQRPRRGARPVLRVGRRGLRRQQPAGADPGPGALLRAVHASRLRLPHAWVGRQPRASSPPTTWRPTASSP